MESAVSIKIEDSLECPICGKIGFSKQSITGHVELCLNKGHDYAVTTATTKSVETKREISTKSKLVGHTHLSRNTMENAPTQFLNTPQCIEKSEPVSDKLKYYNDLDIKVLKASFSKNLLNFYSRSVLTEPSSDLVRFNRTHPVLEQKYFMLDMILLKTK